MNTAKLDAWITGNYGEDHPDNQENEHAREAERIAAAHRQGDAHARWWRGRFGETEENNA